MRAREPDVEWFVERDGGASYAAVESDGAARAAALIGEQL